MRPALPILAFVTAAAVIPDAAGQVGPAMAIEVEIGETVQLGVGNAIGWFCDNPSLVAAAIITDRGLNYWVVEGAQEGTTQCRVGTDPSRASYVFTIAVKEDDSNRR